MNSPTIWPAAFFALLLSTAAPGAERYEVALERGVPVRMRDGTVLRADIYRPKAAGKFPVLLQRTPYNKAGEDGLGHRGAERGYVMVIQDCRGRYTSEGEWYTFKHESDDAKGPTCTQRISPRARTSSTDQGSPSASTTISRRSPT